MPECPECGGSGWKRMDLAGRQGVARCPCREQSKVQQLIEAARIPPRYQECKFESFLPYSKHPTLGKAKTLASRFVEEFPLVDGGLLILGPCGVGKTHLAVSIIRALMLRYGTWCVFYDFRELLKQIQSSFNPAMRATEWQILEPVLQCDVLLLDDLGAERPTDWVRDTFAYIINHRYNQRRTTLITSNFKDGKSKLRKLNDGSVVAGEETLAERIGDRLRSRLYEMCKVIRISANDFRVAIKQAEYE
jgi:DNA replication protein DnaC